MRDINCNFLAFIFSFISLFDQVTYNLTSFEFFPFFFSNSTMALFVYFFSVGDLELYFTQQQN